MAAWTAVGLALAYWIWPDAIVQKPLGDSRLETLLQAAAAIVVAVASLMIAVSAWLDS